MKVLTRYLLRSHIGPFLFAFFALTGVVLINTLAQKMADLAGKGLPMHLFVEFFMLSLPANVALTLPMSVLVAVLYTFSSMAEENEITALKASGIDLRRMVRPLLVVAAIIAVFMLWFNNRVLPAANYRWRILMMDVAQTSPLVTLRPEVVNPISAADGSATYYLQAREIDQASNRLEDVTIYDLSNSASTRTIYADSGRIAWNASRTDLLLTLFDGSVREVKRSHPGDFNRVRFQRQVLRMPNVAQKLERTGDSGFRTDRDMTVEMMYARIDSLDQQAAQKEALLAKPVAPSAGVSDSIVIRGREIPYTQAQLENLRFQIRELKAEIQKKYAIAAATLVFVLLGVPTALRFPRGGIGMVIAVSLSVFSIYYVGLIGGETLANAGYVPPWLAMWLANLVFGAVGIAGLWHLGREQSSGRGGGWGELPRWLRLPALRRRRRDRRAAEAS
ncbi:MAG TPA: LptF/LptG family permease [Longimicrobiaceae bacterium]|nr:LptF/LptG family permease [Longimicrobiaceae bacterium]